MRENLDPFGENDDVTLNSALRASGLYSLQTGDDKGRITLDTQIASGGGNLSVGQKQIIALARAIVRGSKLLVLDEGSSFCHISCDCKVTDHRRRTDIATSAIGMQFVFVYSMTIRAQLEMTDYETDIVIQSSLRHELKGDMTVITVAHRLQTIMDADKIVRPFEHFLVHFSYKTCHRWSWTRDVSYVIR